MPRLRFDFRTLTLFEDEEAGDTHMAMYATVVDSNGALVAQFKWNNLGTKVNETATYGLAIDQANPSIIDVDLNTWATIAVQGYADDDNSWPNPGEHENDLGSATAIVDPSVVATLGSISLGPTTTDNGNAGFSVNLAVTIVAAPQPGEVRLQFENLVLYQDEEWGDTHMAVYVYRDASTEIFRWNNGSRKVDETATYGLSNGSPSATLRLNVTGPTQIWVEGYADDDQDWPSSGSNENSLGRAVVTIDPSDPSTFGQRQLGPTRTDNDNTGFVINFSAELLPAPGTTAALAITGVEVTQAIQYFQGALGPDNSLPLVADKDTLVRVYLDSGLDASAPGGGTVPAVTGTLRVSGSSTATIMPIVPMTAKPSASVNPAVFTDTLNFVIPAAQAQGSLELTVQATGGGSTSAPVALGVSFTATRPRRILMMRLEVDRPGVTWPAPTQATYLAMSNSLPVQYPIATDPAKSIIYATLPGRETYATSADLTTDDGWDSLKDDVEDLQEDYGDDDYKILALLPNGVPSKWGGWGSDWDNYAIVFAGQQWHELGHAYGLDHAPSQACNPNPYPDNVDDDFAPPNGMLGGNGVDVVNRRAFSGASTFDTMAYCFPRWMSGYHWRKLFNRFKSRNG